MLLYDMCVIYGKSNNEFVNVNIEFVLLYIVCLKNIKNCIKYV